MILLKRNFKFYGYLLMCMASLIAVVLLLLYLNTEAIRNDNDKLVLLYIICSFYCLFLIYIFFTIISAVRRIELKSDGILFGKKEWKWSEIKEIRFSEIGFLMGLNENQTVLVDTKLKRQVIYNSYYKNFAAFSSYIIANRDQLQPIQVFPKEVGFIANYSINKKYKAYMGVK